MPFNDGSALAVGGKVGRGVVLSTEKIAVVRAKRREDVVTLASGLSNIFNPMNTSANVLNDVIGTVPTLYAAEAFVSGLEKSYLTVHTPYSLKPVLASIANVDVPIPATSVVWEPNKNYVIPYLVFHISRNAGATVDVMSSYQSIKMQTEIAISRRVERPQIEDRFSRPASASVSGSEGDRIKINFAETFVYDTRPQSVSKTTQLTPATATIEDYKPPAWGNTGSGSGLKSTRIIAQKDSFFELYLNFDDCKVTDAIGLPQGLVLEGSYIKGSPVLSGRYPVTLKLSNERNVDVYIVVPELQRHL